MRTDGLSTLSLEYLPMTKVTAPPKSKHVPRSNGEMEISNLVYFHTDLMQTIFVC